jgi:hypothetical protein
MVIFWRPFIAFSTAFLSFGAIASFNRLLEPILNQENWPKIVNGFFNLTYVVASIFAAVQLQMAVFP